jgi:hypothetical protein
VTEKSPFIEEILDVIEFDKFKVKKTSDDSYYYILETDENIFSIRISNHRTKCQTWLNFKNIKHKKKINKRLSIVIEETQTFNDIFLKHKIKDKIVVDEYVFNARDITLEDANLIGYALMGLDFSEEFIDPTDKGEYNRVISIEPQPRGEGIYHNIPKCKRK